MKAKHCYRSGMDRLDNISRALADRTLAKVYRATGITEPTLRRLCRKQGPFRESTLRKIEGYLGIQAKIYVARGLTTISAVNDEALSPGLYESDSLDGSGATPVVDGRPTKKHLFVKAKEPVEIVNHGNSKRG